MADLHLFVYGTLRTGGALENALPESTQPRLLGSVSGRLYHLRGCSDQNHSPYPVAKLDCRELDTPFRVVGEVVTLDDDHPAVQDVIRMEIGAGYDPVEVSVRLMKNIEVDGQTVTTESEETVLATAFNYRRDEVGGLVKTGDWIGTVGFRTPWWKVGDVDEEAVQEQEEDEDDRWLREAEEPGGADIDTEWRLVGEA